MKIARDGLKFILPAVALSLIFLILRWWALFGLFLVLSAAFVFFFRDPERVPPAGEGRLVAPADGRILAIESPAPQPRLGESATRITVFLSLLDVHVTRAPVSGSVGRVDYRPGKFLPAYRPEAGEHNESCSLDIRGGPADVFVRQIVGVAARRIKCFVRESDRVSRGQRLGLMYFGSRIELDLPPGAELRVGLNEKIRAGETVIAEVKT
jgi:phosphatidylserine decarboxylase